MPLQRLDGSDAAGSLVWQSLNGEPPANWMEGAAVSGVWTATEAPAGEELWMRREFELATVPELSPLIVLQGAGAFEVYLNGRLVPASQLRGMEDFRVIMGDRKVLASLRPGKNLLAIHGRHLDPTRPLKVELFRRPPEPG